MPSKSTSSSSSERRWIYDVFLSFRGTDTRTIFISHLYNSLTNAGIYVFKDNEELRKGGQVSSLLMQAIQVSRISIIVFSKNYANSKSCLKELQRIMDCRRSIGQVVVPVFYNVEPSHVRHQRGAFGRSFQDLKKTISKNKAQLWGTALRDAASLTGFHLNNSRNESEDINKIIETITESLDNTVLFVAQHPVGVQPRAQHVIKLLNYQKSKDVMLLGILGIGGIGKTTIAKAIYNQIHRHFESYCFLSNIRELWEQSTTSQVYLQERLLSDIYKTTKIKIHNIESGIFILQQRLRYKRALLILDDVDKIEQLKALCGSREWFGPGSRIIITTRDEHLLKLLQVDHISRMPEMDQDESIQHFSWHAFKQPCPGEDFDQLSRNVVAYCGGLPLALEVIGSFLFDKKVREWGSVVDKLKRIPNDQVQRKLRISFDSLNDDTEKEIFLDIAFFFIGMDRNDVIHILDEYDAAIGISVLVDRSLVTIDNNNKLGMHDLLRDMGREIVREKSPKEPEERSRLWLQKDVYHVLSNHMGTKAIEGLTLKLTNSVSLEAKMFKMMKRLRLLQLAGVQLDGNFEDLPKHLRWLQWHECNLKYIPSNSDQASLVAIELEFSNLKFVWKEAKGLMTTTNEFSDKYWLTFGSKGSSVVFEVPQMNGCNLKAVTLRILYSSSSETILSECLKNVLIINYTKSTIQVYKQDTLASLEDEEGKTITSHIEPGNKVEILLVGYKFIVKRTTVYLIYDEPVDHYAEHYQADVIVSSDNYIISSDNNDMEIDECSSVSGGSHDRSKKKYSCFYWCWR
ncbi:disease resistance protein RPV1-like [Arachis duranensis]|uniref:Disease resistance protein RPV1-like n=1 Tax=Arachis duranensis TaxID=130453 RepID=A0A6P4CF30_ARADU|nr:disease resistance protein RPV1-like [Arachis duranensis]